MLLTGEALIMKQNELQRGFSMEFWCREGMKVQFALDVGPCSIPMLIKLTSVF